MKEQAKTVRVRVLKPFYLTRDVIAQPGEELELDTALAGAMVGGGRAEPLTATHVVVDVPPPAESEFRKPDAPLRAASSRRKKT